MNSFSKTATVMAAGLSALAGHPTSIATAGSPTPPSEPQSGTRHFGQAIQLYQQEVACSGDFALQRFTIEGWINVDYFSGYYGGAGGGLIVFGSGGQESWAISAGGSGVDYGIGMTLNWNNGPLVSAGTPAIFKKGCWQHFAVSYDGAVARIFRNGEEVASQALNVPVSATPGGRLGIGNNFPGAAEWTNGSFDEIRVWNVVRTPEEIRYAFRAPLVGDEPGLFAYYNFDAVGGTVLDISGNGRHGSTGRTTRVTSSVIPQLTTASAVSCKGDAASFVINDSEASHTFQWRRNGTPIVNGPKYSGAQSKTLTVQDIAWADAGSYDCIVTTACGDVISNAADLDVDCNCTPATPLTMTAGVVDGFSTSSGTEPATPRSGFAAHLEARNPRPFLPFDLVPSGATENRFLAHSFVGLPGDITSAKVEFRVRAGGSNNAVAEGTDLFRVGHSIGANDFQGLQTFFGNENAPSLFTFPWRLWTVDPRGDQTITTPDLSQTILDRVNTLGYLDFMVEDDTGVDYVTLRAMRAAQRSGINVPWVRTQPNQTTIACPGTAVNLAVAAGGSGPFTYQWRLNGTPVDAGANSSASTPTLSLIRAKGADSGVYDCVITNACTSVTTSPTTLSVCASDFNCDGFVTFEDFDSFVSAFEGGSPSADFNADGFLTFEDFDAAVQAFETGC